MSTEAGDAPPEPRRRVPRGARRAWRPSSKQLAVVIPLVGLVSTVVSLVFVFKPGWKPQPPPDAQRLTIDAVKVRQPFTFGHYYRRLGLSPGTLSKAYLAREGVLIEFHYTAVGFRGKELPLHWELMDAATNDHVAGDDAISIRPSTNDDARRWYVWVLPPKTKKIYYVTVTVYQPPAGHVAVPLQDFDSARFRGRIG